MPLTLLTAQNIAEGVKDLEDVRKGNKKQTSRGPPVSAGQKLPLGRMNGRERCYKMASQGPLVGAGQRMPLRQRDVNVFKDVKNVKALKWAQKH